MRLLSWLKRQKSDSPRSRTKRGAQAPRRKSAGVLLSLDNLEDRSLPSFAAPVNYDAGTDPQAVVTANFNGGATDLAVANDSDSTVSVLLGSGAGGFAAKTDSPTGANPRSLVAGDVSGDGKIDLVTANAGDVSILRGDGAGNFASPGSILLPGQYPPGYYGADPLAQSPQSVATGDFNGDGLLDLAVIGVTSFLQSYTGYYGGTYYYQADNAYVNVLISDGSGGFNQPVTTLLSGLYPNSLVAGRFNADGNDDLAIANSYYGTVSVLLSDGSGGFSSAADYYTGSPYTVAVGDVNGDLNADLVTANIYGNSVSVLLGNGAGGFGSPNSFAIGTNPQSVALADFNGDHKLDIVTASNSYNGVYTGQVDVLLGYGDGTFAPPTSQALASGAYAIGLGVGDFDGDNRPDVAVANSNAGSGQVSTLLNAGGWVLPSKLSINDVSVTEGDSGIVAMVFTVTRSGPLDGTTTVNYSTADGGALAGSDYIAATGTLTFGAGETTKTITIQVKGDVIDEYDQGFYVNLSGASGAVLSDGQGSGTILDNDPPPTVTITAKVSGKEGNSGTTKFNFIVTLSAPSEKDVYVNFSTANGTATTADGDYVATSGTLYFAPGQTSKTISVSVKGDKKKESNETFFVNLSSPTNATIEGAQGIGEILDDDTPAKGHKR